MIIKSMSRKEASFTQLLHYIDREIGQEDYAIRHNLFAWDREDMGREFEQHAQRLKQRKNGVYLFHEIISLSRSSQLSEEMFILTRNNVTLYLKTFLSLELRSRERKRLLV